MLTFGIIYLVVSIVMGAGAASLLISMGFLPKGKEYVSFDIMWVTLILMVVWPVVLLYGAYWILWRAR